MKKFLAITLLLALVLFVACTPAERTLTVRVQGAGAVALTVGDTPAGRCDASSCSFSFPAGTQVGLEPLPGAGQFFRGWEGACSGYASCLLRLDEDAQTTASFEPIEGSFAAELGEEVVALPPGGENRLHVLINASEDFNVPEYAFRVELTSPLIGDAVDQVQAWLLPPTAGSGELVVALQAGPSAPLWTSLPVEVRVGPPGMEQELTFLLAITECTGGCDAN